MGTAYLRMGHAEEGLRYYERADRLLEGKDTSMKQVIEMAKQGHFIKPTRIFGDGILML